VNGHNFFSCLSIVRSGQREQLTAWTEHTPRWMAVNNHRLFKEDRLRGENHNALVHALKEDRLVWLNDGKIQPNNATTLSIFERSKYRRY
jgi:hypothetical protein